MTDVPGPDALAAIGLLDEADIVLDEAALVVAAADRARIGPAGPVLPAD
ncbi:MAG: hypothetical protein ACK4MT_03990 [Thermaurantiacus tibetensis]